MQRECRVSVAGPPNLAALRNSLQIGFRTLAIQKRSSEVWTILGAVKAEFDKFGDIIGKVQKKLQEASNVIDSAAVRTRVIGRKLRDVQEICPPPRPVNCSAPRTCRQSPPTSPTPTRRKPRRNR